MNKNFMAVAFLIFTLIFIMLMPEVYALEQGKTEGWHKKTECRHRDLDDKFSQKAHLILQNREELGLSDEQVKKIKDLALSTKKDLIMKEAEIKVLALDIKAKMWEDTIDINAINKLIDRKYELKKVKAKSLVEALAALKNTLTKEQREKLKGLCPKYELAKKKKHHQK